MRKKLFWMALASSLILSILGVNTINVLPVETHDIAVISVTSSRNSVRLGELVNVTVVVENQGTEAEIFNSTVYYDTTPIETKTDITLATGANTSLTFTWNTTDLRNEIYATTIKEISYTINATVSTVPDETEITDNTLVSLSKVKVMSQYIAAIPQSTVDPDLTLGKNYTISIYTDYNGTDVWSWQFILFYNSLVLHGLKVTNGDLITTEKHSEAKFEAGTFNNTSGQLSLTVAYFNYPPTPVPLTSGPGILTNVTFTVVGYGTSDITIRPETKLIGWTEGGYGEKYDIISIWVPAPIARAHLLHGFFQNTETATHDIAVMGVTPFSTSVELGELLNVTVVVENQGTLVEKFDVTVERSTDRINWWLIGTKNVPILEAGANITLTFAWNTTNVPLGTYIIRAVASPVSGEEDTEDNTLESEDTVAVTAPRAAASGLPIEQIIAIVGAVVVVGAVAAYAIIRRRKPTPELAPE